MPAGLRAIPVVPAPQGALRARRDSIVRRMATCLTAVTAGLAVVMVAVLTVALSIT
jgi:hypothetical protein